MSQEYILAIVLVIGSIFKFFNIEIENQAIEGIVTGFIAIWIAYRRYQKKDINIFGARV